MFWNFLFGFAYVSSFSRFQANLLFLPAGVSLTPVYVCPFEMGVMLPLIPCSGRGDMVFTSNLYPVPFLSLFFVGLVVGELMIPATVLGLTVIAGILLGGCEK